MSSYDISGQNMIAHNGIKIDLFCNVADGIDSLALFGLTIESLRKCLVILDAIHHCENEKKLFIQIMRLGNQTDVDKLLAKYDDKRLVLQQQCLINGYDKCGIRTVYQLGRIKNRRIYYKVCTYTPPLSPIIAGLKHHGVLEVMQWETNEITYSTKIYDHIKNALLFVERNLPKNDNILLCDKYLRKIWTDNARLMLSTTINVREVKNEFLAIINPLNVNVDEEDAYLDKMTLILSEFDNIEKKEENDITNHPRIVSMNNGSCGSLQYLQYQKLYIANVQ